MTDLLLDEKPILNTGLVVQLTETPQKLDDLSITIHPTAKFIRFYFDPSLVEVIARLSHDANFLITSSAGVPVVPLDVQFFNIHMFLGVQLRSISGTVDVFTEQFDVA